MLLISITSLFSQEANELPNCTLPSPEAYAITQYGDLQINESTGKISQSIPIFTYTSGKINIPITMNYFGAGVKVDQGSTWTGVNWTLNAGGVITRTVYHKPDELATQRIFKEDIDALNINFNDPNLNVGEIQSYFNTSSNQWDTQPDIFNFNFLGYSGSFFLNKQMEPTLITYSSEMKIEGDVSQFVITTADGVKFYFDAIEITLNTQGYVNRPLGYINQDINHNIVTPVAPTAFYLTKIEHPVDGLVFLEYEDIGDYDLALSQSQSIQMYTKPFPTVFDCMKLENDDDFYSLTNQEKLLFSNVIGGKVLKKIRDSNGYFLTFNSDDANDVNGVDGGVYFKKVLRSITEGYGSEFKAEFDYIFDYNEPNTPTISDRFFLTGIRFNQENSNDTEFQEYQFTYKTPLDLPHRFSSSQDALGYYNGKSNPDGLLPNVNSLPQQDILGGVGHTLKSCGSCTADRSTNFELKTIGALTKVKYPTGGHTKYGYESPWAKEREIQTKQLHVYEDMPVLGQSDLEDVAYTSSSQMIDGVRVYTDIDNDQDITIHASVHAPGEYNHHFILYAKVTDVITGTEELQQNNFPQHIGNYPSDFGYDFTFSLLAGHRYKVELILDPDSASPIAYTPVDVNANFTYTTGHFLVEGQGLRVNRVSDYENDDDIIAKNYKRYYYYSMDDVINKTPQELADYYKEPIFYKNPELSKKFTLVNMGGLIESWIEGHPGYTLGINAVNYSEQNISNYENLTISHGGDNFENGGVSKRFYKNLINVVAIEHEPRIKTTEFNNIKETHLNAPWLTLDNGKLLKEIIYKRVDEVGGDYNLTKLNEKQISYGNGRKILDNAFFCSVASIFQDTGSGPLYPPENIGLGYYRIASHTKAITKEVNTAFYSEIDSITTITDYKYDSYASQPTKVTTTTSESDIIKEANYYYTDQVGQLSGLTPGQITTYTTLDNENRVASPIHTEQVETNTVTQTSKLLVSNRTLYKDWTGMLNPEIIQSSKGLDDLEDKVVFHLYDDKGKPLELSKPDGVRIVYLWTTDHNKPLAKIVNATHDQVQSVTGDLRAGLPNAQVTTYTYIGYLNLLSTVTDPRGDMIRYTYDEFNRLKFVKDAEGNILSKNDYNYRPQN